MIRSSSVLSEQNNNDFFVCHATNNKSFFDILHLEIILNIFDSSKANLPSIALVNKQWKEIADSEGLYNLIFPTDNAFDGKDWLNFFTVDPGKAPLIPRRAYGDIEKEGGRLTFIPEKIKIKTQNGDSWKIPLYIETAKELAKNCKSIHKNPFHDIRDSLRVKRTESAHWVWIKAIPVGEDQSFEEQKALVKEQKASVCRPRDMIFSLFTYYIKTGKRSFFKSSSRIEYPVSCYQLPLEDINSILHIKLIRLQEECKGISTCECGEVDGCNGDHDDDLAIGITESGLEAILENSKDDECTVVAVAHRFYEENYFKRFGDNFY